MSRKIVIVGGVALGASTAARLRRLSEEDEIILLEKDEFISFANCGLPYYIGDVIKNRSNLIVETKEGMKQRYNIDVRTFSEAIKINREEKYVVVRDLDKEYNLDYDYLVLAMGAKSISFPIEGLVEAKNVFKLQNIPDTDNIKRYLENNVVKDAVIIGAGFIGLEMAENLNHLGINVNVVDKSSQVMKVFDFEMGKLIQNALEEKGVTFYLGNSVNEFVNEGKETILDNNKVLKSDLVIMAIGVKPNTKLAEESGLELGEIGGIKVNEYNKTSDESIYAGGDIIEVNHFVSQQPTYIALAGPANRQGRLIADNINGLNHTYKGTLGSSVIKVFDYIAAATGLNEKNAKEQGYDVGSVHVNRVNHASYYPGASQITLKLVYDKATKKVLGAQAFGQEGTEKRIDVLATAIKFNATIFDLQELELCYAPPFSSAKDPVNIAGYVAENVENDMYKPFYVQDIAKLDNAQLIDVRSSLEYKMGHIANSINLNVDTLRDNLDKIDFDKDIYLTCQVGLRGYLASQILRRNGFKKNIYNLSGGYKLYHDFMK